LHLSTIYLTLHTPPALNIEESVTLHIPPALSISPISASEEERCFLALVIDEESAGRFKRIVVDCKRTVDC
jgi:hypothetical protein